MHDSSRLPERILSNASACPRSTSVCRTNGGSGIAVTPRVAIDARVLAISAARSALTSESNVDESSTTQANNDTLQPTAKVTLIIAVHLVVHHLARRQQRTPRLFATPN